MNAIIIEVITQHYIGQLSIEPVYEDYSLFSVYHKTELLGRVQPVKKEDQVVWYSHQINDKELLEQVGEWIEHHFPLTGNSFKPVYEFKW
jgi:hypothetical protein